MRPMTPDDLYAIAWVSDPQLSPDGRRVAFVVTRMDRDEDAYRSAIWVVDSDGKGAPAQFTAGAKRDTAPRWSPDGRWLAFLSERGEEKPQLAVISADGGESRLITSLKLGAGPAAWAPDSQRIAFSAKTGPVPDPDPKKAKPYRRIEHLKYKYNGEGFVSANRRHLFTVALDGGDPKQITDGDWNDAQPAWSPDGGSIAFVSARHRDRDYDIRSDVFLVPATGGQARRLTDTDGAYAGPSWSSDGSRLACYRTPTWPSNPTLHVVEADGSGLRPVDPAFDRNSGVGASLDAREPARWLADGRLLSAAEDRGEAALIAAREGGSTEWLGRAPRVLSGFSSDGTSVAFVASSATEPAEIFLIDGSGRERRLTDMNAAWRAEVALSQPEKFTLQTDDPSVDIDCWVMKPAGFREGRKYPVLLNIHGGPFTQYGEGFFDEFQVYAGAGYGVVYCNPRGSSGQDTPFGRAVIGDLGGPDYRDITAAFESALARMPWADEGRLGVMGGSYGGFMTTWVIGHTDRFAAAISERAVNDWYLMQGTSDIGGTFNPAYLGERATIHEDLDAVLRQSPITYAKDIRTPVLILHSEDDLRCPISQGEQLFVALKLMRRDVEFVRFPDENHELTRSGRPSHRIDRFDVVLDYWARKLGKASSARGRSKPAPRRPR